VGLEPTTDPKYLAYDDDGSGWNCTNDLPGLNGCSLVAELQNLGAVSRSRTRDIQFTKLALYRLSYNGDSGDHTWTRTKNRQLRRLVLYPVELCDLNTQLV
jgi:hypothetical protein